MYGIAVYKLFMGGYVRRDIPTPTLSDTCARPSASRRGAHNETRLRRGFAGLRLCEPSANDRGEGQASSARRDGVSNPRVVLLGRGVTPPLHHRGGMPARGPRARGVRRGGEPRRGERRARGLRGASGGASGGTSERPRLRPLARPRRGADRRTRPRAANGAPRDPRRGRRRREPPARHRPRPSERPHRHPARGGGRHDHATPGPRVQSQTRPRGCPLEG